LTDVPRDLTEDEIVEIYKNFFLEHLANTLAPQRKEECARYLEEFHSDDPRLMLIADVLRNNKIIKPDIPWAKVALVARYDQLRKQGLSSEEARIQTASTYAVSDKTVESAITQLRKHYGLGRGDPFPFAQIEDPTGEHLP